MRLRWLLWLWLFGILFPVAIFRQVWPGFRRHFDALFYPDWVHVLMHILLFAGFTLLLAWNLRLALTPVSTAGMLLAALVVGVSQEALQTLSQDIFWLPGIFFDLGVDLVGGLLGLVTWRVLARKLTGGRTPAD
jgi:hypothetical protein